MERRGSIGIALMRPDAFAAHWAPGQHERNMDVIRFEHVAGAPVDVQLEPTALLPVSFVADGHAAERYLAWVEKGLRGLKQTWEPAKAGTELATCLSVSPAQPPAVRQQYREAARRCGWNGTRIACHNLTVALDCLRLATSPINALICHVQFDGIDLSVVSALKGVVRVRDHVRLRCLSQQVVDELIIAGCLEGLNLEPEIDADWYARWMDAFRIRYQLGNSTATALEISRPGWDRQALVEIAQDDLWPHLEADFANVVSAALELLEENQLSAADLAQVLVTGGSPLTWTSATETLAKALDVDVLPVPGQTAATGAALCAAEPEMYLAPATDDSSRSKSNARRRWEQLPCQARSRPARVRFHVEPAGTTSPSPTVLAGSEAPDAEYERALDKIWSYLRGVRSENPGRARQLVEQIAAAAGKLLDELPQPETSSSNELSNPHLQLAEAALAEGDFREALSVAHQAYEAAPQDASVFREMVNVHIKAAAATDQLDDAIRCLECAHAHDPSNRLVHAQLADRYRRYALELIDVGQKAEALTLVRQSLRLEPFNQEANALAERLVADLTQKADDQP